MYFLSTPTKHNNHKLIPVPHYLYANHYVPPLSVVTSVTHNSIRCLVLVFIQWCLVIIQETYLFLVNDRKLNPSNTPLVLYTIIYSFGTISINVKYSSTRQFNEFYTDNPFTFRTLCDRYRYQVLLGIYRKCIHSSIRWRVLPVYSLFTNSVASCI